jgi:hypothetical protein
MKTMLSAAALFGLLLAASASNPAAATETYHRGAAVVAGTPGAGDLGGIIFVDDDQVYDNRYRNKPNQQYNQWPYPQQNNIWPYGQQNYGNYQGDSEKGWRDRNWNNQWSQPYQGQHYGQRQPLPKHVIVHRLRQHHFYNVQKIKAKNGYYRVYAFDRYRRPVSVIVDPYTGRILRVGLR